MAMGAVRARSDDGFAPGYTIDADIQEAADQGTQNACYEIDDRHLFFSQSEQIFRLIKLYHRIEASSRNVGPVLMVDYR